MIDLQGQTAVVTGGGRGLGRAFAQALAAAGFTVAVLARSQNELDETVRSIGPNARAYALDVTDAPSVAAAFQQIGPVDLLVNNAGIIVPIGPFAAGDFDQWWRTVEVNLRGTMLCAHAVLAGMTARGRGRILNIVTGPFSAPYLSAYLTSKTAVMRATECLAAENRPHGVSLFSVAPGTVRTGMSMHSLTSAEGQHWLPWYRRVFDQGLDLPAARPAALVLALASGKYDALTGLYLTPFDDLDLLLAEKEAIERDRLHSLQLRPLRVSAEAAAIASIRTAASTSAVAAPPSRSGSRTRPTR